MGIKYTVNAEGVATAVAEAPSMFSNMTTGVMDSLSASKTVAYSGAALRHIAIANMVLGAVVGNYLANRAWQRADGGEPRKVLGFFTA